MPIRPPTLKPARPAAIPSRDQAKRERDKFYSGSTWERLRLAFLTANPLCERCLAKDILEPAVIAHHKQERLLRPDLALDPSNLEAICSPCHTKIHKTAIHKAKASPTAG